MKIGLLRQVILVSAVAALSTWACKSTLTSSRGKQSGRDPVGSAAKGSSAKPSVKRTAGLAERGPLVPGVGFPAWYKDALNTMLEPCYPPDDNCLAAPAGFDTAAPVLFPTNFPDEIFWHSADAIVSTAGGGQVTWHAAIEGAFLNEVPVDGDRVVFGRIRIRGSNLQPGKYRIVHPYGVDVFDVADAGPNGINFTEDIAPAAENFTAVLGSRVGPFLRWDPSVGAPAPAGYLGTPGTLHEVTGSPYGTNFVRVERLPAAGSPLVIGEETRFAITGKIHQFNVAASLPGGTYNPAPSLALAATLDGSTIKYSMDGSDPATGETYTAPIVLPAGATTVRFVATNPLATTSASGSATYVVDPSMLAVGLGADGDTEGTYDRAVMVSLQGYGDPEKLVYTLDGSDPATSPTALVYSTKISFDKNGSFEVRALASKGDAKSATRKFRFNVKIKHTEMGPVNVSTGFPYWYRHLATNTRLQPCLISDETKCLPLDGVNPGQAISFPNNFPGEHFYWTAEATGTFVGGGSALLVLAIEGAFANEIVQSGDQSVFGRIRIRLDTPTSGFYRVTHPFGVDYFNVDSSGRRTINSTEDIELAPGQFHFIETGRVQPLLPTPVIDDPTADPSAKFIANPAALTAISGSPFGTNEFRVDRHDGTTWVTMLRQTQFAMSGHLMPDGVLRADIFPGSTVVNQWPVIRASASEHGATLWYTIDGSDPRTSSSRKPYAGPFVPAPSAGSSLTVKIAAEKAGFSFALAEATYTLDTDKPTVSISPVSGTISGPTTIKFASNDPSATIYYTLDETDPRDSLTRQVSAGSLVIDPVPLIEVRAVAQDPAGNFSNVEKERYSLGPVDPATGVAGAPAIGAFGYALDNSSGDLQLAINWSATTISGTITKYTLERSVDGSVWTAVALPTFTTTSTRVPVLFPISTSTMKFRVMAETSFGIKSAWTETPLLTLTYIPETFLTGVSYNGRWTQTVLLGAIGGSARTSQASGDRARVETAALSIVGIGSTRATGASVEVRVDNRVVETVDMSSAVERPQVPFFVINDLAAGRRRVEFTNRSVGRDFVFDGILTLTAQ